MNRASIQALLIVTLLVGCADDKHGEKEAEGIHELLRDMPIVVLCEYDGLDSNLPLRIVEFLRIDEERWKVISEGGRIRIPRWIESDSTLSPWGSEGSQWILFF